MAGLFDYLTVGGIADQVSNRRLPTQEELIAAAKVNPYGLIQQGGQALGDTLSREYAKSKAQIAGRDQYTFSDINQDLKDRVNQVGKKGGTPIITSEGGVMPPPVFNDLRQGVLSSMSTPQLGELPAPSFTASGDQFASLGFPQVGQNLMQAPQDSPAPAGDQFPPEPEDFNALGFETIAGSQEELMQQTAETMSNLKTGKDVTPIDAAKAAEVIKQDTVNKGGDPDLIKEAPEGVDKGVWKGFNDQFDLTTIGLTLLATNGNGKNLAANMGLALQAGRESKKRDNGSKADAKVKAEDRALAAKKTVSEIKKNDSMATKNISEAVKNASESSGVKLPKSTAQGVTQGASYLKSAGVTGKLDNPEFREIAGAFSQVVEGIRLEGEILDPNAINQKAFEWLSGSGLLEGTSFWQSGKYNPVSVADRQGQ